MSGVLIIGSGLSSAAAAAALVKRGYRPTVLDVGLPPDRKALGLKQELAETQPRFWRRLLRDRKIQYVPGLLVEKIRQGPNWTEVQVWNLREERRQTLKAAAVLIGAGVLSTSRILLQFKVRSSKSKVQSGWCYASFWREYEIATGVSLRHRSRPGVCPGRKY